MSRLLQQIVQRGPAVCTDVHRDGVDQRAKEVFMRALTGVFIVGLVGLLACGGEPQPYRSETMLGRSDPIVGGKADKNPDNDAVVKLSIGSGFMAGTCTGALISQPGQKGVVLTARHCVSQVKQEYVTCGDDVAGDYDPNTISISTGFKGEKALGTGEKIFHDAEFKLCNADISLIVMQNTVSGIKPLRVRTDDRTAANELFRAIGYGKTSDDWFDIGGSRYLRDNVKVVRVGPMPFEQIGNKEFSGTSSICQGDSGGPAVSANFAVMGVVSRGPQPCATSEGIWGRPDKHLDIINKAIDYAKASYIDEDGVAHGPGAGVGGAGGAAGSGGAPSGGGGGSAGAGGSAGDPGTGGTAGSGGTAGTGGTAGAGGTAGVGGTAGTGGTQETGGNAGTGGMQETGGNAGTGGTQETGGNAGTGGTQETGGNAGTAGTGGAAGTSGGSQDGGVGGKKPDKDAAQIDPCQDFECPENNVCQVDEETQEPYCSAPSSDGDTSDTDSGCTIASSRGKQTRTGQPVVWLAVFGALALVRARRRASKSL